MIFDSANYVDYHQNHLTNSNEPYMCLSVSKELSLCFESGEDNMHRNISKFIGYSETELRPKNQTFL